MTLERGSAVTAAETGGRTSDEAFRARLREFFTAHHPGRPPKDPRERLAWTKAWLATLFDAGYAGPSWPREFGGMELSFARQVIYHEEAARARVPGPLGTGLNIAAPTIIKYGTAGAEASAGWPRCCAATWYGPRATRNRRRARTCRACAPPPAVTARSTSSTGRRSGRRTPATPTSSSPWSAPGTRESRQKGITYLVIDAHAPGVQVRPLRDLTGGHLFAEVFFDDVRVPVANRIGEENDGWRLARTSLGHERAAGALNQAAMYRRVLTELEQLARERGQLADPLVRDQFVDLEIRVRHHPLQRASGPSPASWPRASPAPPSSVSRLLITAFEQDIHEFAVDLLGPAGLLGKSAPQAVQRSRWLLGFLRTRASTIGAGTREIQLNTVAEQVLGLPHDPGMPPR